MGYVNEVGEVFCFFVLMVVVWLSYGVVSFYVLVDVIDKGKKVGEVLSFEVGCSVRVIVVVVDIFVW